MRPLKMVRKLFLDEVEVVLSYECRGKDSLAHREKRQRIPGADGKHENTQELLGLFQEQKGQCGWSIG